MVILKVGLCSFCSRTDSLDSTPVPPANHTEPLYSKVEPSSSRHRRHQSVCGVPGTGAQPQVATTNTSGTTNHLPEMNSGDILTDDLAVSNPSSKSFTINNH